MKRAAQLRGLSEDHHHGLVHARKLRRAASGEGGDQAETAEAFLRFWQGQTTVHFREEEEVLLPVLARHGGEVGRGSVAQMLAQHARLRGLVMELSDEVGSGSLKPGTLDGIGELLEAHIRLEEREVFPMIEEVLPKEGLEEIASRLKVKRAGPHVEPWVPKEGLSYDPWPGPGDSEGGGYEGVSPPR